MMSKNLIDNFPVSVEFNQFYNLLFISWLLVKKKFFRGAEYALAAWN